MGHIQQDHTYVKFCGKKVKVFPIRTGIRQKCLLLLHLFDKTLEDPARTML